MMLQAHGPVLRGVWGAQATTTIRPSRGTWNVRTESNKSKDLIDLRDDIEDRLWQKAQKA